MGAKLWKKIALAVCIIAILFNITNKLVKKTNLKDELQSVLGGEAISFSEENTITENGDNASAENTNNAEK